MKFKVGHYYKLVNNISVSLEAYVTGDLGIKKGKKAKLLFIKTNENGEHCAVWFDCQTNYSGATNGFKHWWMERKKLEEALVEAFPIVQEEMDL